MLSSRRNLATGGVALAALAALAACNTSANGVVTVNLAVVQAQAKAFYTAIAMEEPMIVASFPTAASQLAVVMPELKAAVDVFTSLPSTTALSNTTASIQALLSVASTVLPIVTPLLSPATGAALSISFAMFSALAAGLTTVNVPTTAAVTGFKAGKTVNGPVPIPLT